MVLINGIATETIKWFIPIAITVLAGVIALLSIWHFVKILRQQFKLHNSITLVQLKRPRMFFIVVASMTGALDVYCLVLSINPPQNIINMLDRMYVLDVALTRMIFISLTVLLAAIMLIMIQNMLTRAALVDRGIYIGSNFIDWHHIYDYYVDEKKNGLLLSTNKLGPLSLKGTTTLFKFDSNDVEKIKFILNKNKNKFIPRYELR